MWMVLYRNVGDTYGFLPFIFCFLSLIFHQATKNKNLLILGSRLIHPWILPKMCLLFQHWNIQVKGQRLEELQQPLVSVHKTTLPAKLRSWISVASTNKKWPYCLGSVSRKRVGWPDRKPQCTVLNRNSMSYLPINPLGVFWATSTLKIHCISDKFGWILYNSLEGISMGSEFTGN